MGAGSTGGDERAVVEAHLRRLDTSALAAFVEDLWAVQGFDTEREGSLVRATGDDGTVLIVVADGSDVSGDPDIVVDLAASISHEGPLVLDAEDLSERLWYAVDRPTARRLCERHFGARPADLPLPLGTRLVATLRVGRSPAVSLTLVVVVLVAVAFGVSAGIAVLSDGNGSGVPGSFQTPATHPQKASGDGVSRGGVADTTEMVNDVGATSLPPGVSEAGIVDIESLSNAHASTLENRSYTVKLDRYRPEIRGREVVDVHRDVDINVSGDTYRVTIDEVARGTRTRLATLYHDGQNSFAAARTDNGTTRYRPLSPLQERQIFPPEPDRLEERVVTTRLSTPTTNVTGARTYGVGQVYLLGGDGPPAWPSLGDVEQYHVTALVTSEGLLREAIATYTVRDGTSLFEAQRVVSYTNVGTARVDPPQWYRERFAENATNA